MKPKHFKFYYENGNIEREEYRAKGEYHREDGPAVLFYYEDRNIELEDYFINGKRHRENGPAYIQYNRDGSIKYKQYYLNGVYITDEFKIMIMETLNIE